MTTWINTELDFEQHNRLVTIMLPRRFTRPVGKMLSEGRVDDAVAAAGMAIIEARPELNGLHVVAIQFSTSFCGFEVVIHHPQAREVRPYMEFRREWLESPYGDEPTTLLCRPDEVETARKLFAETKHSDTAGKPWPGVIYATPTQSHRQPE